MAEKANLVQVEIFGQTYSVKSGGDAAYVQKLAAFVDEEMKEVSRASGAVDSLKVAVLAALNLADEGFRLGRTPRAYRAPGGPEVVRGGHIPGAINIPLAAVTDTTGRYLPPDSLQAHFEAAGVKAGDSIIAYCNVGRTASPIYVAAKLLGYDVRLYDGSFEEWSRRLDLPVETTAAK